MQPDVIFIGAGPIGLLAAIQLKLECPDVHILMFEKYQEPLRNHAMYVDKSIFKSMNRAQSFGDNIDAITPKIIISDLEKSWRTFAQQLGIGIYYQAIQSMEQLERQYPKTTYFVGSGGLKGIMHPQIFNAEKQVNDPLRHAAEVKYKAAGATRPLQQWAPAVLARCNHSVSEYVGHLKEGVTPVSLRIFIDQDTHEAIREATFRTPYTLADEDKIPKDLFSTIKTYMHARQHMLDEKALAESLKISTITLSLYASKTFCKHKPNGKTYFQIGEEAFACPFYRSFNDNARCVPYFVKAMKALLTNQPIDSASYNASAFFNGASRSAPTNNEPLTYYTRNIQHLINREMLTVRAIHHGLRMVESVVSSSQRTPNVSSASLYLHHGGRSFLQAEAREPANNRPRNHSSCAIL